MSKRYTLEACEDFISRYESMGGRAVTVEEGVLGLGTVVLDGRGTDPALRSFIIREVYVNEWVSGHTVRGYRVLPKKWAEAVDEHDEREDARGFMREHFVFTTLR